MGLLYDQEHDQQRPTPNAGPSIHDMVKEDLEERKRIGVVKYGTKLQAHNGRDPLLDAYHEVLDLAVYLRQRLEEDKTAPLELARFRRGGVQ